MSVEHRQKVGETVLLEFCEWFASYFFKKKSCSERELFSHVAHVLVGTYGEGSGAVEREAHGSIVFVRCRNRKLGEDGVSDDV